MDEQIQAQENLSNGLRQHGTRHLKERIIIRPKVLPKAPRQEEFESILDQLGIDKI